MGNRADRRATAKIAKQAVKRAKTPTETGILRAAAAFAGDGLVGHLAPHISAPDFDATWDRLGDDLRDILDEHFPDFMVQAYLEAGGGLVGPEGPGAPRAQFATRLILCPIVGPRGRVRAFASDAGETERLARSLRECGVVAETGRCLVAPVAVALAAFSPQATTPGQVRALHDRLATRLVAGMSGETDAPTHETGGSLAEICETVGEGGSPDETVFAALVGIELVPVDALSGQDMAPEAADAEEMARAAAISSWHDTYAAELAGLTIGAPLDWPACAAALAFETLRVSIEEARHRHGLPDALPDTIHCGPTSDGKLLLVSALFGETAVGPFQVPTDLVWFDADEFFDLLESSTDSLVEHEDDRPVLASLLQKSR